MAIRISKELRIILYVLLGILVLGGSGYLVWRINQPDTVAPEDSEAALICPDGCYPNIPLNVCTGVGGCEELLPGGICKPTEFQVQGYCCDKCLAESGTPQPGTPTPPEGCRIVGSKYSTEDACNSASKACTESERGGCFYYSGDDGFYPTCCPASTSDPITTYTLRYSAGTGGSITGNSSQTVNRGANGTAVTAVANTGYTFTKWSDDKTTNPRTDTNVQGNINVTAQFEESAVITNTCEGATWIEQPEGTYNHCTSISARVENRDVDGIDTNSIVVKLNGEAKNKCSGIPGEVCYQTNVVDGKTRILMNLNNNYCLDAGSYTLSFEWKDGLGNAGCNLSTAFSIAPQGEIVVEKGGDTVPQTGLLDTVLGRVSLGFGFIFLGGLVSQYSKLNYMYESIQQKGKFRREISKQKRMSRERDKFERRVR